jgi:hypothetical protein
VARARQSCICAYHMRARTARTRALSSVSHTPPQINALFPPLLRPSAHLHGGGALAGGARRHGLHLDGLGLARVKVAAAAVDGDDLLVLRVSSPRGVERGYRDRGGHNTRPQKKKADAPCRPRRLPCTRGTRACSSAPASTCIVESASWGVG